LRAGHDTSSTAAQATTTTTSTTEAPTSTTTEPEASTTTTAVEAGGPDSGLGASGSGSVGQADDLANTGGLPLAVPGGVLLALAVVSRRLASR
jgi:nitrogenase subunit NifH